MQLEPQGILDLGDCRLDYRFCGAQPGDAPTFVLLHEGLGSAELWGDFPDALAQATGAGVFAYSRIGYGRSSPVILPRPLSYMHDEAQQILPLVLDAIAFQRGALIGHSDGASIVLIDGARPDPRIVARAVIAPHVFIEDVSVASIKLAHDNYAHGDLRARLARWHDDVDGAFRGWCDSWLNPGFHHWNITEFLPAITAPLLVVQGDADAYGTRAQVHAVVAQCGGAVEAAILPGVGHNPMREAKAATISVLAGFLNRALRSPLAA